MGKLERLQREISEMTPEELAAFDAWYLAFEADAWDRRIERDAESGALDDLAQRAVEAHRSGRTRPL
jgi:hypothetical protein